MATAKSAHARRFVLLLWMLVAFFYFYLSYDYIRVTTNDRSFEDYLEYVVQIAGQDHRPAKEIRALLLVKAEELGLPIKGQDINILGGGESLNVSVGYEMDIDVPLLQRQMFSKHFDHSVHYKQKF
jgi:hypothetical protein